jgi:5-(carboxyamino)imidazole ribonucleotide mutase
MSKPFVAILMGSDSDLPTMQATFEVLKSFDITYEVRIHSAHRTPEATHNYVTDAEKRGCQAFICAAGLAITVRPVIGVPMDGGPLKGQDALLSTVQMPGGIPVATVAIGKTGAKNAGYLAAQIMAVSDAQLAQKLRDERESNKQKILARNAEVQKELGLA